MTDVSGTKNAKGEKFLNKAERKQCWDARDNYQKCFKENQEDEKKCQDLRKIFTDFCPGTWVTHFDRRFQYEKFKEEASKKGYASLDEEYAKKTKK